MKRWEGTVNGRGVVVEQLPEFAEGFEVLLTGERPVIARYQTSYVAASHLRVDRDGSCGFVHESEFFFKFVMRPSQKIESFGDVSKHRDLVEFLRVYRDFKRAAQSAYNAEPKISPTEGRKLWHQLLRKLNLRSSRQ